MSLDTLTSTNGVNKAGSARRQAAARKPETTRSWKFRVPRTAWIVLSLIVGMGIGALTIRQRYHADHAIAAVNGVVLTKEDFFSRLEQTKGPAILQQMVTQELQMQYARKLGVAPTEVEINARYDLLRQDPQFAKQMATSRQTPEDVRRWIAFELAWAGVLGQGQKVTEADMRAFYRAQTDRRNPHALYYQPATATISVIITPGEADSRKALSALARGVPFAKVADTYSTDRSKQNGGALAPIVRGRTGFSHIPGLVEAIFGMKVHDQLGPRRFAGYWWIVRCMQKTPETVLPYEKVREYCRRGALIAKGVSARDRKIQMDFASFCKGSTVQAFWPQYSQTVQIR